MIISRQLPSLLLVVVGTCVTRAAEDEALPKGLRVLSTGNSFHYYVPPMPKVMAREAGINGHV